MKGLLMGLCIATIGGVGLTAALVRKPQPAVKAPPPKTDEFDEKSEAAKAGVSVAEWRKRTLEGRREFDEWRSEHEEANRRDAEVFRWMERVLEKRPRAFPKLGTCYSTRIKWIGERLGRDHSGPYSGSAVIFENALYQVDYEMVPPVVRSRPGDKVTMCVVSLPKHCPKGDFRGVEYRTFNKRTREYWIMADSEHDCTGI